MKKISFFGFLIFALPFFFLVFSGIALAYTLPANVQNLQNLAKAESVAFSNAITLPVAFLAGALSLLSPCILALLPAFFAISFQSRKRLFFMLLMFTLGFTTMFILFGLFAASIGHTFSSVQFNAPIVPLIAGLAMIFFGLLAVFGKGFSGIHIKNEQRGFEKKTAFAIYLWGMFFALGWSACLGPILAGILSLAGVLNTYGSAALLLGVYSLGIAIPLFLLAFFYDHFKLHEVSWIKGKMISWKLFGKKIETHSSSLIAGIILVVVGITMIIFGGTNEINNWSYFGLKQYFYDFQRSILTWKPAVFIGVILFTGFIAFLYFMLKNTIKNTAIKNKRR